MHPQYADENFIFSCQLRIDDGLGVSSDRGLHSSFPSDRPQPYGGGESCHAKVHPLDYSFNCVALFLNVRR